MEQIKIRSNIEDYKISRGVIGFAGINGKGRSQSKDTGDIVFLAHENYYCVLYHNPAVDSFHQPQDSLGISFNDNDSSVRFALADGVSLVKGILENDSGELAKRLVIKMCKDETEDKLHSIKRIVNKFQNSEYLGASTLITGEITKENKLKALFIGSKADIGSVRLLYNRKIHTIDDSSNGFAGEDFRHDQTEQLLPDHYSLVIASDGAKISDTNLRKILKTIKENPPLETLEKTITDVIEENPDDQSLMIIMK